MPRFSLLHPTDASLSAQYGFDPTPLVQWFCDVFMEGRSSPIVTYDAVHAAYRSDRPVEGLLDFLIEQTFFCGEDIEAALLAFMSPEPGRLSQGVRRALKVIENLKQAAD